MPDKKFETVGEATDPVAVRQCRADNRLYFYFVNREPYSTTVNLEFNKDKIILTDMADMTESECESVAGFRLAAFELKVFTTDETVIITSFSLEISADIIIGIFNRTSDIIKAFETVKASGAYIPGMDKMEAEIKLALEQKRYSWLRHAATSYISCKALSMCEEI